MYIHMCRNMYICMYIDICTRTLTHTHPISCAAWCVEKWYEQQFLHICTKLFLLLLFWRNNMNNNQFLQIWWGKNKTLSISWKPRKNSRADLFWCTQKGTISRYIIEVKTYELLETLTVSNFMKPTPRRKWYLTTGRRFH